MDVNGVLNVCFNMLNWYVYWAGKNDSFARDQFWRPVLLLYVLCNLRMQDKKHNTELMEFNISKCVHFPITNKTKPSSHQYSLFGHPLSKEVKLDSKLSWAKLITEITSKSANVLGMVKRT